jgi:CDP-diacylglycerol--glycerol-3-phosphate 3-phosphatidyltransferase
MAKPTGVPGPGKQKARSMAGRVIDPVARFLLKLGVSPDAITVLGTVGVCVGALYFFPQGRLFAGVLVIMVFALSDMLDGSMARVSGRSGPWGAFLDSSLDRIADAAIFGGLVLWFLGDGNDTILGALALYCLVGAALVSYVRARAEGLGLRAAGGIAERTERIVLVLTVTGLAGLGVPYVLPIGLWLLAAAITVTVIQRILAVRGQTRPVGAPE